VCARVTTSPCSPFKTAACACVCLEKGGRGGELAISALFLLSPETVA